jgi:hypothetical protein
MRRILIVNADDYGRSPGVSRGIRRAHAEGIVTTTTALANMPGIEDELLRARQECPDLGLGLHLNLTLGSPCTSPQAVPALVDDQGHFLRPEALFSRTDPLPPEQVKAEWQAQVQILLRAGVAIDHLDSHHHVAVMNREIWQVFLDLAWELDCGVRPSRLSDPDASTLIADYPEDARTFATREAPEQLVKSGVPHPHHFLGGFYGPGATRGLILAMIGSLEPGVTEIMTHPGELDDILAQGSGYASQREKELEILTHASVRQAVEQAGADLKTYRQVWQPEG